VSEEDAFVEAMATSQGDTTPHLIFADWLEDRGDPRAEYVRLDCRLGALALNDPERKKALRRKQAILRAHPDILGAWNRKMAIARIWVKLDSLRQADPEFDVFGSDRHRYQVGSPIAEQNLIAFEKSVGVRLPEEYRCFLIQVGNGGAGPDYGLYSLSLSWRDLDTRTMKQPFPISTRRARAILTRQRKGSSRPQVDSPLPGCLELSDAGCGIVGFLVVTGEQRGTVWYGGADPLAPVADLDGQQLGFLGWSEGWLDGWLAPEAIKKWRKRVTRR
jgi:uncharacterized protein (TIGR02996 family)